LFCFFEDAAVRRNPSVPAVGFVVQLGRDEAERLGCWKVWCFSGGNFKKSQGFSQWDGLSGMAAGRRSYSPVRALGLIEGGQGRSSRHPWGVAKSRAGQHSLSFRSSRIMSLRKILHAVFVVNERRLGVSDSKGAFSFLSLPRSGLLFSTGRSRRLPEDYRNLNIGL
jgi:hypothetical protein